MKYGQMSQYELKESKALTMFKDWVDYKNESIKPRSKKIKKQRSLMV